MHHISDIHQCAQKKKKWEKGTSWYIYTWNTNNIERGGILRIHTRFAGWCLNYRSKPAGSFQKNAHWGHNNDRPGFFPSFLSPLWYYFINLVFDFVCVFVHKNSNFILERMRRRSSSKRAIWYDRRKKSTCSSSRMPFEQGKRKEETCSLMTTVFCYLARCRRAIAAHSRKMTRMGQPCKRTFFFFFFIKTCPHSFKDETHLSTSTCW